MTSKKKLEEMLKMERKVEILYNETYSWDRKEKEKKKRESGEIEKVSKGLN